MKWWSSSGSDVAPADSAKATTPPGPRAGGARKLRRRLAWSAAAVALYALAGFLGVPWIASRQIPSQARTLLDREATTRAIRFNPFTFVGVIEGLELKDRDGAPLLKLERLRLNLQLSSLWRRAWTFKELEIQGLQGVARILADGRLSVTDLPERPAEEPAPPEGRPMPRLVIFRLVLSEGRLDFVDESRTPAFSETFAPLSIEVHDLTTLPDAGGDHALDFGLGPQARIHWEGRQMLEPLRLEGKVDLTRARMERVWKLASRDEGPLAVREGSLDLTFRYQVDGEGKDGGLQVRLDEGRIAVTGLKAGPAASDEEWVTVPVGVIEGVRASWPEATVDAERLVLEGPRVAMSIGEAREDAAAAAGGGESTPAAATPAWSARVRVVEVRDGAFAFEDRSTAPPVVLNLTDLSLKMGELTGDPSRPIPISAGSARVNDSGELGLSGTVTIEPLSADLQARLARMDLIPLGPWLRGGGLRVAGGVLGTEGRLRLGGKDPWLVFEGDASVDGLSLHDASDSTLLSWKHMGARKVALGVRPESLRIREVEVQEAFARVHIDSQGKLKMNLESAPAPVAPAAPAPSPAAAAPAAGSARPMAIDVGRVTLSASAIDYADESLILPFASRIHTMKGVVRDFSTTSAAAATLDLEGRVDDHGIVRGKGALRFADPLASSDLELNFRQVEMPRLTPYTAQFAGYAVKEGQLDLDVHYRIQNRQLVGDHRLVASNLIVGDKVEGGTDAGLPIRLAVALLKDKDGRIDLQVPIEGNVDAPEFAYSKIMWQAVKKILVNIAAAPFRALGRLFGRDEEDLELVGFVAGRSDLVDAEKEKLSQMAAQLAGRTELSVEIEGRFDPVADPEALREDALQRRLDAARAEGGDAIPMGAPGLELILERLYEARFTREKLDGERARFQPQAAADPNGASAVFDATGFYDALRAALRAAEPVTDEDLKRLATGRGEAIVGALTGEGGVPADRVRALEPAVVKKKKAGSPLVASELTLTAKD